MATEESKQFFCWGEIVREIYVSRAGDPVHAGDKTLTRERANRYDKCLMSYEDDHDDCDHRSSNFTLRLCPVTLIIDFQYQ